MANGKDMEYRCKAVLVYDDIISHGRDIEEAEENTEDQFRNLLRKHPEYMATNSVYKCKRTETEYIK
jgi:hypothetical protein